MIGYNLLMNESDISRYYNSSYMKEYEELENKLNKNIATNIDRFTKYNGKLNAKDMMDNWFPIDDYDVFISHSHKDLQYALIVYKYLKAMGYKPFIDSICWGYSDDLLRQIDDIYCYDKESNTYRYGDRNITTSHVHIMLMSSLEKILSACNMFVFISSENSITKDELKADITESPWIYNELLLSKILINRDEQRIVKGGIDIQESLQIEYPAEVKHLTTLTYGKYINLLKNYSCDN